MSHRFRSGVAGRKKAVVYAAAVSLSAAAALSLAGQAPAGASQTGASQTGSKPLASSAPSWTGHSRVLGPLSSDQTLQLRVWLAPKTAQATAYANAVSNPR